MPSFQQHYHKAHGNSLFQLRASIAASSIANTRSNAHAAFVRTNKHIHKLEIYCKTHGLMHTPSVCVILLEKSKAINVQKTNQTQALGTRGCWPACNRHQASKRCTAAALQLPSKSL
jgi:hypothetical protein